MWRATSSAGPSREHGQETPRPRMAARSLISAWPPCCPVRAVPLCPLDASLLSLLRRNNRLCSRAWVVSKGCRRGRGLLALLQAYRFVLLWLICTPVCTAGDTSAHQAFVAARRQWAPVRRRAAGLPARRAAQQQRRRQRPGLCGARRRASLAALPNAAAARGRLASTCSVQAGGECGREL